MVTSLERSDEGPSSKKNFRDLGHFAGCWGSSIRTPSFWREPVEVDGNIEEVRLAVGKFVGDYNAKWRVEKNGFRGPQQTREAWFEALFKQAA
jgi:hypothetical protein